MTLQKFLEKLSRVLDDHKVEYVISGGVAVGVWGRPRYTADVDIVVEIKNPEAVKKLIAGLQAEFEGAYIDEAQAMDAFRRKSEFNIVEPEWGLKADFFIAPVSEYDTHKTKRGITRKIGRRKIRFISPEDLILSKLAWYKESKSSRHLEDARSVVEGAERLDEAYLRMWVAKLDLEKEWEELEMRC